MDCTCLFHREFCGHFMPAMILFFIVTQFPFVGKSKSGKDKGYSTSIMFRPGTPCQRSHTQLDQVAYTVSGKLANRLRATLRCLLYNQKQPSFFKVNNVIKYQNSILYLTLRPYIIFYRKRYRKEYKYVETI